MNELYCYNYNARKYIHDSSKLYQILTLNAIKYKDKRPL